MRRSIRIRLVAVFAMFVMTGCTTAPQRQLSTDVSRFVMLPNGQNPLRPGELSDVRQDMLAARRRTIARSAGAPIKLLELSGGGQNGAFGAGVLSGWVEREGNLDLDLVTGVSTGTLLATFAYLGTQEAINYISQIYVNIGPEDIYTRRNLVNVLAGSDSIYDTTPLKELIEKTITQEVLDQVAAEYDKDRRLLCATTNMDYEQTWVWDLSSIAKHGGPGALELYRAVVRASASPPIMFPPVEINGSLFADGGTRHNLLLGGLLDDIGMGNADETTERLHAEIYVIMNNGGYQKRTAVRDDIKHLIPRSINMMIAVSSADSVLRAYFIAKSHGFDFNLVSIPKDVHIGDNSMAFDHEVMQRIYQAGITLGRNGSWQHQPPPTDEMASWFIQDVAKDLSD